MKLTEFYKAAGGSLDEVLTRIPNEKLIIKYLMKFPSEPASELLKDAFKAQKREEAFRAAHTLKGLCATLGLARLTDAASRLTEALRLDKADFASLSPLYSFFTREYDCVTENLRYLDI